MNEKLIVFKVGDRFSTPCGLTEVTEQSFGCVRLSGGFNFWCGTHEIQHWIDGGSWRIVKEAIG